MIGCNRIRERRGLRIMILSRHWDIREICDPLFLCGLLLGAAVVIYDLWVCLPERVRVIHRNTEEHVQQVKLVLSVFLFCRCRCRLFSYEFSRRFPFLRAAQRLIRRLDARSDRRRSRKLSEGKLVRRAEGRASGSVSGWTCARALDVVGSKNGCVFAVGARKFYYWGGGWWCRGARSRRNGGIRSGFRDTQPKSGPLPIVLQF
jgi:hypothetical protein